MRYSTRSKFRGVGEITHHCHWLQKKMVRSNFSYTPRRRMCPIPELPCCRDLAPTSPGEAPTSPLDREAPTSPAGWPRARPAAHACQRRRERARPPARRQPVHSQIAGSGGGQENLRWNRAPLVVELEEIPCVFVADQAARTSLRFAADQAARTSLRCLGQDHRTEPKPHPAPTRTSSALPRPRPPPRAPPMSVELSLERSSSHELRPHALPTSGLRPCASQRATNVALATSIGVYVFSFFPSDVRGRDASHMRKIEAMPNTF
jgi:hypothetical protein